jgi:hypothetical protein
MCGCSGGGVSRSPNLTKLQRNKMLQRKLLIKRLINKQKKLNKKNK